MQESKFVSLFLLVFFYNLATRKGILNLNGINLLDVSQPSNKSYSCMELCFNQINIAFVIKLCLKK